MLKRVIIGLAVLGVIAYGGWQFLNQPEYWLYSLDAKTGKVVWSTTLPNSKRSTSIPVTAEGRVFVGQVTNIEDNNEAISLSAFDAASGKLLWEFVPDRKQFPRQDSITWFAQRPYALGDLVFMTLRGADDDKGVLLLAIDAQTGTLRWTLDHHFEADQGARPEVALVNGKLIALQWQNVDGAFTYFARVIEPQTGKVLTDLLTWKSGEWGTFDSFHDPFLQSNADMAFILTDKAIYAFDPETGERRISIDVPSARYAVSGDMVFVQRVYDIMAYDAHTGQQRWKYHAKQLDQMHGYFSWIMADHDTVRIICNCAEQNAHDGTAVYVLDAQTGQLRFTQATSDSYAFTYFLRAPATDDVVLTSIGRYSGADELTGIAALDAKDGSLRWQFVTAPTRLKPPATDGEHVFVTTFDTRLRSWLTPMNTDWRFSVGVEVP